MDRAREFFVLSPRVCVRLTSVRNEVVDGEMTVFVSELPASRGPQQIPQYCRDVIGGAVRIDPIDGSGDSEQRDLCEILGGVCGKAAAEIREEGRTQAFEQSLEGPLLAGVHCSDALR
jgi:hypothetical protein